MDNIQNQAPRANQHSTPVDRLRETLDAAGINYTIHAHDQAIESAQDGVERGVGGLANMAPALVLRADEGYLVAIIRGDTRLSYKKIKKRFGLKNLSLATPEQVQQATGSEVRQVSLLNAGMVTMIDSRILELEKIYGGCGVPCFTLEINPQDLTALTRAQVFDFAEPKEKSAEK